MAADRILAASFTLKTATEPGAAGKILNDCNAAAMIPEGHVMRRGSGHDWRHRLLTPKAIHRHCNSLRLHQPTAGRVFSTAQRCQISSKTSAPQPTVAVAAVIARQLHHLPNQTGFVAGDPLDPSLRTAGLMQNRAGPTARHPVASGSISHVLDRPASFRRAQKFPEADSFKIVLSSSTSASKRFSRAFSFSSSFSRFDWSTRRPRPGT